jgi:hypothetical protein
MDNLWLNWSLILKEQTYTETSKQEQLFSHGYKSKVSSHRDYCYFCNHTQLTRKTTPDNENPALSLHNLISYAAIIFNGGRTGHAGL